MNIRLLLAAGVALLLLGVSLAIVLSVPGGRGAGARGETFSGPLMPSGLRAFGFTLTDQYGRRVALADTRGRPVVITFVYSKCRSTCPVTLQTIRGALDDLSEQGVGRRDVTILAVTVDPERDTRRNVRRFLARQQVGGFVRYLTAPRRTMAPIWKRYGIAPQHGRSEGHTAFTMLVDRRGILRVGFPSAQMTSEDLAHDLRVLLAERA